MDRSSGTFSIGSQPPNAKRKKIIQPKPKPKSNEGTNSEAETSASRPIIIRRPFQLPVNPKPTGTSFREAFIKRTLDPALLTTSKDMKKCIEDYEQTIQQQASPTTGGNRSSTRNYRKKQMKKRKRTRRIKSTGKV